MLVLGSELCNAAVVVYCIYVAWCTHRTAVHKQCAGGGGGHRCVVVVTVGELGECALGGYVIHLCGAVPGAHKIEALAVVGPAVRIYVAVECGAALLVVGEVALLACCYVHYAQAVAVALVAVAFHTEPRKMGAVGRECRCGVISIVGRFAAELAQVLCGAVLGVVEEYVGVGAQCVGYTGLFNAGVCYLL